MFALFAEVK